jgi:hypothetical protein
MLLNCRLGLGVDPTLLYVDGEMGDEIERHPV